MTVHMLKIRQRVAGGLLCYVAIGLPMLAVGAPQESATSRPGDAPGTNQQSRAQTIEKLIEQLADPNFRARESAHQRLLALGLPAFERLRDTAANHANPEIARAARYLLGSQQVNWALETDSLKVRDLLQNYNDQPTAERETRQLRLSKIATPDALAALARLARFEANEDLSRAAGAALLEALEKISSSAAARAEPATRAVLVQIEEIARASDRIACQWLTNAARDAIGLADAQSNLTDKSTWETLAEEQTQFAEEGNPKYRQLGLRYFEWLGKWTTRTLGRETAVELSRGILQLLGENQRQIEITARVLLDHKLPELLVEIAAEKDEQFQKSPRLSFLHAEALLQLGDTEAANRLAEETSDRIGSNLQEQLAALSTKVNALVIEVARRRSHAAYLYERGMFLWCEREFLKVIELEKRQREYLAEEGLANLETISDQEIDIRNFLAIIYWEAGEYAKAADVLRPVHDYFNSDDYEPTIVRYVSIDELSASYHYYTGLAHRDASEPEKACAAFLKALALEKAPSNPDIVIAFRDVALGTRYEEDYLRALVSMSGKFRSQLIALEESLTRVQSRSQELGLERSIATECNQLAWLLAKCKYQIGEALQLSLRSVELQPTTAAYLDTLARCYYENGRLDDAITAQQKACALAPHDRQLARQLEEFTQLRNQSSDETKSSSADPNAGDTTTDTP